METTAQLAKYIHTTSKITAHRAIRDCRTLILRVAEEEAPAGVIEPRHVLAVGLAQHHLGTGASDANVDRAQPRSRHGVAQTQTSSR